MSWDDILIVDDDPTFRERLAASFRERELQVGLAGNPAEARAQAANWAPHLAILGLALPEGVQVLTELLTLRPAARCLVVTDQPIPWLTYVWQRLGAIDCLPKKLDASRFLRALTAPPRLVDPVASRRAFPTMDEAMRMHVAVALELSRGNVSRAARLLGISRRSLHRWLREDGRRDLC